MFDCSRDVLGYHDDEVTLKLSQRTEMRDRRNSNRDRLKARIAIAPKKFIKQGSYAMKSMVQDPDKDYDIDDGVYFDREDLKDKNGKDMSARDARQMVRDALKDDRFNKQPEVRNNCVRIYYNEGYHVDMPVYRIQGDTYELATGDSWASSRAADVEDWFDKKNEALSPDETNGRQFRRIVRDFKKFSRSRRAWKKSIASGFTITKLVSEHYVADKDREDRALRETMRAIHARLVSNLEVKHPIAPWPNLTGPNDESTAFLRDRLKEALETLKVLDDGACTRAKARKAWDEVFSTTFFSDKEAKTDAEGAAGSLLANMVAVKANPKVYDKREEERFA